MTREIKFRAWEIYKKKMIPFEDIYYMVGCNIDGIGECELQEILTDESYIFQQYTGLKDKNGKEIYEGDIIQIIFDNDKNLIEIYHNTKEIHIININLGCDIMHDIYNLDKKYIEVIGNIYENPDLLDNQ